MDNIVSPNRRKCVPLLSLMPSLSANTNEAHLPLFFLGPFKDIEMFSRTANLKKIVLFSFIGLFKVRGRRKNTYIVLLLSSLKLSKTYHSKLSFESVLTDVFP